MKNPEHLINIKIIVLLLDIIHLAALQLLAIAPFAIETKLCINIKLIITMV